MSEKKSKIFISHSTKDKDYAIALVDLLEDIGLRETQIFCSSVSGYGIPLDEDIYEYLKKQFNEYDLHLILILSNHYYESIASLNEMGAAWVLQKKYTLVLLPNFEFKEIKGAINPRKIGLKLDNNINDVKEKIGQLKDIFTEEFDLETMPEIRWEQKRDEFLSKINIIGNESKIEMNLKACHYTYLKFTEFPHDTEMDNKIIATESDEYISQNDYWLPMLTCEIVNNSKQTRIVEEPYFEGEIKTPNGIAVQYGFLGLPFEMRKLEPGGKVVFRMYGKIIIYLIDALLEKKIENVSIKDNFDF